MNFKSRNKSTIKHIIEINTALLVLAIVFLFVSKALFNRFDFGLLDIFYRNSVKCGHGIALSEKIVYVLITDDSYKGFQQNTLDRQAMAEMNKALAEYDAEAVIYDLIFARPSQPAADKAFADSLAQLGNAYLPVAVKHTTQPRVFQWQDGVAYARLRTDYLKTPLETGEGQPYHAIAAFMQYDDFARVAFNSGDISAISSDPDGVYRHAPLLLKVDTQYLPTLALAVFLNYVRVPFDHIRVDWGHTLTIPALPGSFLDRDVILPIDTHGRVFIPYPQVWQHGFKKMELHKLLQLRTDTKLQGNLTAFFEGKFVFVGDVSTGISDLGHTPLEDDVPLIVVHTALLNALLNNTFYGKWSLWQVIGFLVCCSLLLGFSALPRALWPLCVTGTVLVVAIPVVTWQQLSHFSLVPIVSIGVSSVGMFGGLLLGLHVLTTREEAFIHNAFAKFVHPTVVDQLIDKPELLILGGEERELTVLFSDLAGFTSISADMSPIDVVRWLNEYMTAMTEIIIEEGGTVDKYIGDAVMAEFGAPLLLPDHANRAVRAGLRMQRHLDEVNRSLQRQGLPLAQARIGINTGHMVVGNMGSRQVFNYTVIGDAVNLASRLESANKRYGTTCMISEFTHRQLTPGLFHTRLLDVIKVKGREKVEPVQVFEVYGEAHEPVTGDTLAYYETYRRAFEAYLQRDFVRARRQFVEALACRPHDAAAIGMLQRLESLTLAPLPAAWDGSVTLEIK